MMTTNPFDENVAEYEAYRTGYSRTLYDALAEFGFVSGWHVLDIACGTGLASEPLARRGVSITGVDISERMLENARQRIKEGTFVLGKAEALPFGNDQFNAAICAQAIHWFDQPKALAEMHRVVKPGGRVAIWWKSLVVDEPIRTLRSAAAKAVGLEEPPDLMRSSFRAFYQYPFEQRWLRVLPHVIMSSVDRWMGYERSRARLRHYGDKAQNYLAELEQQMRAVDTGRPFHVRYTQFLYVGQV